MQTILLIIMHNVYMCRGFTIVLLPMATNHMHEECTQLAGVTPSLSQGEVDACCIEPNRLNNILERE